MAKQRRKHKALRQFNVSCEQCNREIVCCKGHWKCPFCGWHQHHRAAFGRIIQPEDSNAAFLTRKKGREIQIDSFGVPVRHGK